MVSVVSFVGPSGSGKTTLIERVIRDLSGKGFSVAAVKHAHHGFDLDQPGKDSFRFKQAGALSVGVVSRDRWAIIADEPEIDLTDLLVKFPPCDLVIIEGGSRLDIPKIEIIPLFTSQISKSSLQNLIALVGKDLYHKSLPCFDRDNISGIAVFLINRLTVD